VRDDVGTITETDFGYTGQRNISGADLMDYNARFYGQTLGRFPQPDSIIPSFLNPQSLNRYSYALNNPIRYTDPSGHYACAGDGEDECDLDDADLDLEKERVVVTSKMNFVSWVTRENGVEFEGDGWKVDEKYAVAKGVKDLDDKLKEYDSSFSEAFGTGSSPYVFEKVSSGAGYTPGESRTYVGPGVVNFDAGFVVHELGHALGNRYGGPESFKSYGKDNQIEGWYLRDMGLMGNRDNPYVFTYADPNGRNESGELTYGTPGEISPDIVVALVYGYWDGNRTNEGRRIATEYNGFIDHWFSTTAFGN